MKRSLAFSLCLSGAVVLAGASSARAEETSDEVVALEEFIAYESGRADQGDILPTSRPFLSLFGEQSILDVPRSVTVVTPVLMDALNIADFSDLGRVGAGTQQINYYGVPGTPSLRGARGAVFFDGMQRAFQRNEMPLSFGSVEAMDVVKGPAPAHFGASLIGGYVNLIPKSPYFDRSRGSVRLEIGSYDHYRGQVDVGGPFLLGASPAAYRLSLTAQDANSYYDRIGNDFVSLYGALRLRLGRDLSVFTGGEYFRFNSNENAGWNRPTQQLIDSGEYVVGEPLSIVSPAWGGVADRDLLGINPALVVPSAMVEAAVAQGTVTEAQRDALLDLADPAERAQAYADFTPAQLAAIVPSTSGYQYTRAYFGAGGRVFTQPIEGHTILSDRADHADSENLLYFLDVEHGRGEPHSVRGQLLVDALSTDKLSTYGYAIRTRQRVVEAKLSAHDKLDVGRGLEITYGVSARYTDALMLQDFFVEPFSRRDITRPQISPNTVILTGPQRDPTGKNFWSPTSQGGANAHSKLWQLSAFGYAAQRLTDSLTSYTSVLVAHAPYRTEYPGEVDRVPPDDVRRQPVRGHRNYASVSWSPLWRVARGVNVYATGQYGTALDPLQGGAIVGEGNFSRNQLLEVGAKASLVHDTLFASLAAYRWRQTSFDERTNKAEPLAGEGVEFETTFVAGSRFSIVGSAGYQRVRRLSPLGQRALALTPEQIALYGGVLNSQFGPAAADPDVIGPGEAARPPANPALEYPGTPHAQLKLFASWKVGGGWTISGGPIWSSSYWHNFDHTLRLPATVVWNAAIAWHQPAWDIVLSGQNLTDEDTFLGAEPVFGANTLITKAPGTTARLTITRRF